MVWDVTALQAALQHFTMKKALRETQTLRAGCSKAETKNLPCCRPPSRGRRTAKI